MSKLDETYRKIIETLERNIKENSELTQAKQELDSIIQEVIVNYDVLFKNYDKKIDTLEIKQAENQRKILDLENRVKFFEKLLEMEDYDIFITCPYCGLEFQTDYDEELEEIPCPECGRLIEIDWSDDEEDNQ